VETIREGSAPLYNTAIHNYLMLEEKVKNKSIQMSVKLKWLGRTVKSYVTGFVAKLQKYRTCFNTLLTEGHKGYCKECCGVLQFCPVSIVV
jgi:hypothetical protein